MDTDQRQAIMEKLRSKVKKASSSVSTKVEAQKGDFKVVISSNNIEHFFKDTPVGSFRVAELDDDAVELINSDAGEAAQEMLETFANNFDANEFNSKKTKTATTKETATKEAAHGTQDGDTWQMITQKQFDDQKPDLHPRTDDYPKNITQKQIPEDGQRPGTYDEITEAQFVQEKSTFYNEPLDAGARVLEDRNVVTEGQFEEGVSSYSDEGQSERGEVGSKFDGELAKQQKMIGEKQLAELLKHHEWTEPLTITEGKEQLGNQDGELSRITAEIAQKILKEALNSLANTVLAAGVTPAELSTIVGKLISHPSKYPVLADTIKRFTNAQTKVIAEKVAKAKYFGKVANVSQNCSEILVADILVRQLAKIAHDPQDVVDCIVALKNESNFETQIDEAANNVLENKNTTEASKSNIFTQVIRGEHNKDTVEGSAKNDGMYEYTGTIKDIEADVNDKDNFAKAAATFAQKSIVANIENKDIQLNPLSIDVDENQGTFKIQMKDASFETESIEARAEKRRQIISEAPTKTAQMGGGGGMPPAGGDQMGNPMAPPGGADMGSAPPGESLSQEPGLEEGIS